MNIYDVFISYRRSDGLTIAEELYNYLTSKGLRVFLDKHKMIDGHYFTTQIETNLKIAPNYILVATEDVFKFREKEDWVQKEIEVAIEEYESKPTERTITVLVPETVEFPEKGHLQENIRNIADAQRISLSYGEDLAETFYKTLKSVTNVNRRNLWFAAHRWLENSKQSGGRFSSLNINESILPNTSKNTKEQKIMPINVYSNEKGNENRQSLLDAMRLTSNHLYLIGQGGIGKTTALMHIMNTAYMDKQYSENAQIPIFVELSFAPDTYGTLYEGGKSSFIRRSIYKQVRTDRTIKQITAKEVSDVDEVFTSLPYDVAVQPITDILSKATPAPEYLLLLDGLNEVSTATLDETGLSVVQMVMREIDLLITECPNSRIVLTSRSDESAIYNDSISRLYLTGIDETTIIDYLENFGFSKEHIDKILEDEDLCKTLQIPLFLTMYASLSKYDEASTQGEILKLFFNERRKNISVYSMQERLAEVEKNVTEVASAVQKNRIDADMQNFILDFILPEIAWQMECNNEFYLRIRDIRKILEPVLSKTDDLSVCGEFGREIFSKYRNGASAKMHTYKVAKKITERLGDDITEITESIINCCVFALGIMQESNCKYGFVHQHIRDYFTAVKNINTIRLSVYLYEEEKKQLALECMNKAFKDKPVNHTVRRFMGEYLGEYRNKPYHSNKKWNHGVPTEKCDRNLIKRALDIYRGYFNGECGYGIYSLITILKEIRLDLSGSNFSNLDMTMCEFEGCNCSKCDFRNSLLSPSSFFPISIFLGNINPDSVNAISKDGRYAAITDGKSIYVVDTLLNIVISTSDTILSESSLIKKIIFIENDFLIMVFKKSFALYTLDFELLDIIFVYNDEIVDIDNDNFEESMLADVSSENSMELYKTVLSELTEYEAQGVINFNKNGFSYIFDKMNHIIQGSESNDKESQLLKICFEKIIKSKKESSLLNEDSDITLNFDFVSQTEKIDVFVEKQNKNSFSLIVLCDEKLFKLNYYVDEEYIDCSSQKLGTFESLKDIKKSIHFKDGILFLQDIEYHSHAMLKTENLGCDLLWFSFEDYKLRRYIYNSKGPIPVQAFYNCYFSTNLNGILIVAHLWDYKKDICSVVSEKIDSEKKYIYWNYQEKDLRNKNYKSLHNYKNKESYISESFLSGNEFFLTYSQDKKISLYKISSEYPFEHDNCYWSIETKKIDTPNSMFCFARNNKKYVIVCDILYKIIESENGSRLETVHINDDISEKKIYEKHKHVMDYGSELYEQLRHNYQNVENFVEIRPKSYKYPVFEIEKYRENFQYIFVKSNGSVTDFSYHGHVEIFDEYLLVNSKAAKISIYSLKEDLKLVREFDLTDYISPLASEPVIEKINKSYLHRYFNIHNMTEKDGVFYLSICGHSKDVFMFKLFVIDDNGITACPNGAKKVFANITNVKYSSNVIQLNGIFMYILNDKLYCLDPFTANSFEICKAENIRMFSDGLFATTTGNVISIWDIKNYNAEDAHSFNSIIDFDISYMNYHVEGSCFSKSNGLREYQVEQLKKKGALFEVD